jgi:cytoskeletal protein RodZ
MKILVGMDKKEEKIGSKQLLLFWFLVVIIYFFLWNFFVANPAVQGLRGMVL